VAQFQILKVETGAMRLNSQISVRLGVGAAVMVAVCMSASGRQVFASEQQTTPPQVVAPQATPQQPTGPELALTADEAVRMALENNLGVRSERLGPRIGSLNVAQARALFAPRLQSSASTRSSTSPPDFLANAGATETTTSERVFTTVGVAQNLPWGGGNYSLGLDGSRTKVNFTSSFNPQLNSNLNFNFTQPLLRNFTIDSGRQQLMIAKNNEDIADLQLRQQLTATERVTRNAYYDLILAIEGQKVAQQSLELARESLRQNERRVEVGTMAQIDILEAQAEVSRVEESVIIAEAQIKSAEDNLRTLILNPQQPDYWTARLVPTERPTLTPQPVDVEGAVTKALADRTDLAQLRKQLESTRINIDFARNQKLPDVNLIAAYNTVGLAGTQFEFGQGFPPEVVGQTQRTFTDALRDVFGNNFKTWSLQLQINYPIGTSAADAGYAAARLQQEQQQNNLRDAELNVTAQVREAGRQVNTALQRVQSTSRAREFAERRLEAEQKRLNVGLSTTFQQFQAQRDLANVRQQELRAVIDYNRALVNFQAVQQAPLVGR
jgi:outer membrane protein TolC